MAAYYSLPATSVPKFGGVPAFGGHEDDPVPPQFATRYYPTAAPLYHPAPPTFYAAPPSYAYLPQGGYCMAPCCTGMKVAMPYVPPSGMPAVYGPPPPVMGQAAMPMQRSSSKDAYKEDLGFLPPIELVSGQEEARPLTVMPTVSASRVSVDLDEVDHPSFMRPPHVEDAAQKKPYASPPAKQVSPADSGYGSMAASPVYNVYKLIPAEPMPAPPPLPIELSGAQIADAAAGVIFDTFSGRFGAIGAPSPPRGHKSKPSSPVIAGEAVNRGELVHFVREVLLGTRVAPSVVANAVSYLCDLRLRQELRTRSLQLSFVAALSISHKTLDDSPFTTATWAKISQLDLQQLRTAERAVCYGLDFDVRPEMNAERLIDATNMLMSRLSPDSQGRVLLNRMIDDFILASPFF